MKKSFLKKVEPWLWLAPALLLLFLFAIIPFIKTLLNSFFIVDASGNPISFVFLDNYKVLFTDPIFTKAIYNTLIFVAITLPTSLCCGFVLAELSYKPTHTSWIYETLQSIPCAISMSVIAMIFQLLYMPTLGLINKVFGFEIAWLYDETYALFALSIIQIWSSTAFSYIFYLNSLRNIPSSLIDSALIDGCNRISIIKYIHLPATMPTTIYLLFANFSIAFMMMSLSNILTGGGPQYSTTTLVQYIYSKFISTGNATLANAASSVTFAISLLFISIIFLFWKKWRNKL